MAQKKILLSILALVALISAIFYKCIYPYPYIFISGGIFYLSIIILLLILFALCIVFLGNFNNKKIPKLMGGVCCLYFLTIIFAWLNRPVLLAFEYDRLRVLKASDMNSDALGELGKFRFGEPARKSLRSFKDGNEQYQLILMAINGYSLSANSDLWQNYLESADQIKIEAKKWRNSKIIKEYFSKEDNKKYLISKYGYLPVVSEKHFWIASVDLESAEVVSFFPVDPYN